MRIGEAAAAAGMTTKTLRFYENCGLLPAVERAANGYRDYGNDAVDRVDFIRRGRAAGLGLAQLRTLLDLRTDGTAPCGHLTEVLADQLAQLDRKITALQTLRDALADLQDSAIHNPELSCDPQQICSSL